MGLTIIRGIFDRARRRPRGNTPSRWFSASSLELARVPPVVGVAISGGCHHPWDFTGDHRRNIALPVRLAEAVNGRWACGFGGACCLLRSRGA